MNAAFHIENLRARFRSAEPLDPQRCEQWLGALEDADGEAITAGLARPDEWLLIRRLPLALRWRHDSSDAVVMDSWRQAMRQALQEALRHPDGRNVLRYPHPRAALADLLYRSALGETSRQWAWQRMALLPRDDLSPREALSHGLRQLLAAPELIWPVLHALILGETATASLTALLRGLPAADWLTLLRASPRSAGYAAALADVAVSSSAAPAASEALDLLLSASDATHDLLGWAQARPYFAARHVEVLSVLACSFSGSASDLPPARAGERLRALHGHLRRSLPGLPAQTSDTSRESAAESAAESGAAAAPHPRADTGDDAPALPDLPQQHEWFPTAWAGALFWLRRLPSGGLLDWLATQDQVSQPLLLRALGEALGIPLHDAALRAFCGGEVPRDEPGPAACEQARLQVARWSAWLDEMATDLPEPRLETVCRRAGRLRFEAGWVELHLPLDAVDTAIRRLGLDLDPGWLPWLGCVLRIVYDE